MFTHSNYKIQTQSSKMLFLHYKFNVLNVLFWLTICVVRTYRFWRRKPSKHFETQTIEQLKIPTQKCCIIFIIKCFLQTQNTNSDSELKNALFTFTIQCIYNCSDSLFVVRTYRFWRRKPSIFTLWNWQTI